MERYVLTSHTLTSLFLAVGLVYVPYGHSLFEENWKTQISCGASIYGRFHGQTLRHAVQTLCFVNEILIALASVAVYQIL